jgi:hypothetical protein
VTEEYRATLRAWLEEHASEAPPIGTELDDATIAT